MSSNLCPVIPITRQKGGVAKATTAPNPSQDSSTSSDIRSKLSTGYTRVPNALLMEMVCGDLSRNEIKVLLLVARMTVSFNREFAPLSKSAIQRMTGMQGSVVLQTLQSLEKAGLLRKIPGDRHKPNLLALRSEDFWKSDCRESPMTPGRNPPQGKKPPEGPNQARGWGENSTPKKDILETIDLKNSLSLSSEKLRNYFSELKPAKKREREVQAFLGLRQDYSEAEIERAWAYVAAHGLPGGGQPCHSPMAFLSMAIVQILPTANAEQDKLRERAERERQAAEETRRASESADREARESEIQERAFRKAFPTEERQLEAIGDLCQGMPFSPKTQTGRAFAISAWWSQLTRFEKAEYRE